jgi:hypothetical protein
VDRSPVQGARRSLTKPDLAAPPGGTSRTRDTGRATVDDASGRASPALVPHALLPPSWLAWVAASVIVRPEEDMLRPFAARR